MIYFVRHGSTDWNENKDEFGNKKPRCQGRADIPLNDVGVEQAKRTSETLKNIHFDKVFCSPLMRARQTCDIIYKGKVPVKIDDRLIERDFGEFEGKTRDEFDFEGFCNENNNQKFDRAESLNEVKERIKDLLDELSIDPNQNVLMISHGGVGCVLMSLFKGAPKDGNYSTFEIPNGKPLVLDLNVYIENQKKLCFEK